MHPDLIEKFLKGQCTDEEAAFVEQYFQEHSNELETHLSLTDWLADSKKRLSIAGTDRILQRIRGGYKEGKRKRIINPFLSYAVAASFIGILMLAGAKLFYSGRIAGEPIAATKDQSTARPWKTMENKTGQRVQAKLPDGSAVTIYPNSSLHYLPAFEKNKRSLYLKGTALFEVSRDLSRPFTVYADGIATTALGTKFLVSELTDQRVSVTLMEGSVKVWPQYAAEGNEFVVLRPGDEIVAGNTQFSSYSLKRSQDKDEKSPAAVNAISRKQLTKKETVEFIFKNNSLKEVFHRVAKKFSITINCNAADRVEDKLFTGIFLKTDSLEFICKTICSLHGLQYKIDGDTVTILPQ